MASSARICLVAFTLIGGLWGGGCQNGQKGAPHHAPTYEQLATKHNQRIAMLQTLHAEGVIELTWRDDRGKHFEQGEMDLWLRLPSHSALQVKKLGDTYLWLGSNDDHYWLFDLFSDVKTLHVGRHDQASGGGAGLGLGAFRVQPRALIDLLGLSPIEGVAEVEQSVSYDPGHKAWMIESPGRGGGMRIFFDVQMHLPIRIESLAPNGEAELVSTHRRYESVMMQGMSPVAFPKMAELIDIASAAESSDDGQEMSEGEVTIAINEAFGYEEEQTLNNVFNLDLLLKKLKPARIEGTLPLQTASKPSP
jgi:hypothetical protein